VQGRREPSHVTDRTGGKFSTTQQLLHRTKVYATHGIPGFCHKIRFLGKIQKSGVRNAMTYRLPNSRKSNFATELSCSPGAPRPMKIEFTRQPMNLRTRIKRLVRRTGSTWQI
jgi:hypothetical protein